MNEQSNQPSYSIIKTLKIDMFGMQLTKTKRSLFEI